MFFLIDPQRSVASIPDRQFNALRVRRIRSLVKPHGYERLGGISVYRLVRNLPVAVDRNGSCEILWTKCGAARDQPAVIQIVRQVGYLPDVCGFRPSQDGSAAHCEVRTQRVGLGA